MSKLNLNFYNGKDLYIYSFFENLNKEYIELIKNNDDLTPIIKKLPPFAKIFGMKTQANILSWYEFEKDSEILEINPKFGILTNYLCNTAKQVTVIETSKKIAEVINYRLREKNNLEIIVGNYKDIKINKKFDYIIISDILEQAECFFDGKNPYNELIEFFKNLLKPDGTLIFTLSNRFGIKHWSGGFDEYTGACFESLQNYPRFNNIKSFSKKDLENIFKNLNFKKIEYYYPFPSHDVPLHIYTDKYFEEYTPDWYFTNYNASITKIFNQTLIMNSLYKNNQYKNFLNSYIIFLSNKNKNESIYYAKFVNTKVTKLIKDNKTNEKYSKKTPLNDLTKKRYQQVYEYYKSETKRLKAHNINKIKLIKCDKINDSLIFDFAKGKSLNDIAEEYLKNKDETSFINLLLEYKKFVNNLYPEQKIMDFTTEGLEYLFGHYHLQNKACVNNANFDLNFNNIFRDENNNYTIIDYDNFVTKPIPVNLILAEGIFVFKEYYSKPKDFDDFKYLKILGLKHDEINTYILMLKSYYTKHK